MATTTSTTTAGFSLGISAEDKLSMPLDDLIKKSKAVHKATKPKPVTAGAAAATKKKGAKKPAANAAAVSVNASKKKAKKPSRQQTNVKKTVTVPVSKAARARATTKASSTKRQEVINKRRPGLVITKQTAREVPVKVRSQRTSALRVARKAAPVTAAGKKRQQKKQNNNASGLDVSNIQRHFREHPSKFDLPKDTNLRITINLNKVKPVVGAKK
ncbi:hypothetical protein Gpo141_00008521 [Globisporangium polare]